ncbi:MAG: universal stress protein [Candidatus Hydrogenedentes bacterium]|nr:universal stress protein [Candidatus Hydrogenedentota bacterium]
MDTTAFPKSINERILFCTDFSENADTAFTYALDAAIRRPKAVLHIFHVIPEPDAQFWRTYIYEVDGVDEKAKQDIDQRIESTYLAQLPESLQYKVAVRIGRDYIKILEYAQQENMDLIVKGRHGHSALESVLFGNVTEKVVRKAPCAVLVVPTPGKRRR